MPRIGAANILILHVPTPFTRGGAEVLVEKLRNELLLRDYCVDVVGIPFSALPKTDLIRQMALWRALPVSVFSGKRVDLVIATKFPSYLVSHSNKVTWLVHQHRQVYELYGTRFGDFEADPRDESLRRLVQEADAVGLEECVRRFTISGNVSQRLQRYLGLSSVPMFPPLPLGARYMTAPAEPFILSVGRICSIKRIDLLIRALPLVNESLTLKIVGTADEPSIEAYLRSEIDKHHLWHRVEFLGRVDDETLLSLYARCQMVYYAPFDEDYGFVTLEALASGKPVITATDSGCVLEFVRDEENGLVVDASEAGIAQACNRLVSDRALYARLCSAAEATPPSFEWDDIIGQLTSTLS